MCAALDQRIGSVLDALRDMIKLDNHTSIVFATDHGELAKEHAQACKTALYEEGACAPRWSSPADPRADRAARTSPG
jgi:arylsulfatase A-like enzyme